MSIASEPRIAGITPDPVVNEKRWNAWVAKNQEADRRLSATFHKLALAVALIGLAIVTYMELSGKLW
jgi:hypothetical protein